MTDHDGLNLRYMQVHISIESGKNLPGSSWIDSFSKVEFLSLIGKNPNGLFCYASFDFEDDEILSKTYKELEILEVISRTNKSALAKIMLTGPVAKLFSGNLNCWWVTPSYLTSTGMVLSLRGTKEDFQIVKNHFSKLVGNGFSVKIGKETIEKSILTEILNKKQKLVLDKAISMGYYKRPRECTQREIATILDIKQSTVCEHLQLSESKIFNSINI